MKMSVFHEGADWRYKKGCRCGNCRKAHSKYETKRRALNDKERAGILVRQRRLVDVGEVREHVRFLMENNIGARSIGSATGISYTTIYDIGWGDRKYCTKKVADKILALGVKKFYKHQMRDGKHARQLVHEMQQTGLRKYEIGYMLGYKHGRFNIYDKIQVKNYQKIVDLHTKICQKKEQHL